MSATTDALVVVLATLDTKEEEASFVANRIRESGGRPWIIDISIGGVSRVAGDTSYEQVAAAVGMTSDELRQQSKAEALDQAARGATALVQEMVANDAVGAVLGIGGGTGTYMATSVMRALPLGIPKLMVSTIAAKSGPKFIGESDIIMVPTITDVAGVNRILGPILANAAAAAVGMARREPWAPGLPQPAVAMSMFGVTTAGSDRVATLLGEAGLETIVFHSNGTGGRMMEKLISEGVFDAVVEMSMSELIDELVGGTASAGPDRLTAAGRVGLPQVVVPGAVDVINFGARNTIRPEFEERTLHIHLPTATLMRTNVAESAQLGTVMARKLNASAGPVAVVIPRGGFSSLDVTGGVFWAPDADAAFVDALRAELRPEFEVRESPHNINDAEFAACVAGALEDLLRLVASETRAP
jgi:uncharacterized protein (UPF0261 family)